MRSHAQVQRAQGGLAGYVRSGAPVAGELAGVGARVAPGRNSPGRLDASGNFVDHCAENVSSTCRALQDVVAAEICKSGLLRTIELEPLCYGIAVGKVSRIA